MSILKYKYKAHKFINYAFYVFVFVIGFVLGFGAEKINFNKLISQVLMIDSVQALEITTIGTYKITDEFIYNQFNDYQENFLEEYPYVHCDYYSSGNMSPSFDCHAYSEEYFNRLYVSKTYNTYYQIGRYSGSGSRLFFSISYKGVLTSTTENNETTNTTSHVSWYRNSSNHTMYSNFNPKLITGSDSTYSKVFEDLDFSSFGVNLEFNENLFKDNPDFKEVCVDDNSIIAITRTDNPENLEYMTDYDYIWFPYGVSGLKSYNYHNADLLNKDNTDILEELDWSSDNIFQYDNYSPFFFKDKETIDEIYNDEIKGGNLKFKGYTDKNSYYGWTSALFNLWFDYRDGNDFNFFPIFEFENLTKLYINDSSGTIHGGGGNRLDGDNEIELSNQYCFYIKKEYSVTKVYKNEFNDISGNVPTQNGDFNFVTSQNKNNNNSGDFLSQPKNFINSMKDTINFINSLIYEFYISLPLLLRTFIITLLIILIIMLIMKIGGYS